MYHLVKVAEGVWATSSCHLKGCKITACAGRLLREEDTGKLGAATRCNRDSQTGRYRLRNKDEDGAEPQCECAPPASTPREPKEPARSRIYALLGRLDATSATYRI